MKKGFTLAEVLITLGIIGIVTAMTLPTLIQRQQNIAHITALKKFYSVFNEGLNMMKVQTGCEDTECLVFIGDITNSEWNNLLKAILKL